MDTKSKSKGPEDLPTLFSQVATANSSEYLAHLGMVMTPAFDITGSTLMQPIDISITPRRKWHIF